MDGYKKKAEVCLKGRVLSSIRVTIPFVFDVHVLLQTCIGITVAYKMFICNFPLGILRKSETKFKNELAIAKH